METGKGEVTHLAGRAEEAIKKKTQSNYVL